ncbi:thioredoxin family protein [Afifella sp. IM 167]|uniref:DUF1223 domain-containing protein n=1 Tax=Afifella sp. IM 167 TaxID=2033586 RepID=UPI001CCD0185|nr:DUF1223 domain-containing protein [Afifella sp. IM 167]MBZ8132792.1 DUF1223 domain-containing protein [Afifella sp. IM 167]
MHAPRPRLPLVRLPPLLAAALLSALLSASAASAHEPKAVIELFTSQGCSSCPPADHFLADLADRDEVIALSLPVDYWDYLGWKDTLARPENSDRERAYAAARGDGKVYTPQMVVNGEEAFVGSNRSAVSHAIAAASLPVGIEMHKTDARLEIRIAAGVAPAGRQVAVRLLTFRQEETVPIRGGENRGRTVVYRNVVRSNQPIGLWDGKPLAISLPSDEIMAGPGYGCAVILQVETNAGPGKVLGAAVAHHHAES